MIKFARKSSRIAINILLLIFVIPALFGTFPYIFNDLKKGNNLLYGLLVFLIFLIIIGKYNKHIKGFYFNNRKEIFLGIIFVTLLYQILLVLSLSGTTGWDPITLINRAMNRPIGVPDYFSYNPNTIGVMMIEKGLYYLFFKPDLVNFVRILNLINIILLDGSCYLLYRVAKRLYDYKVSMIVSCLLWGLIVISPYVAIFYSDLLAFAVSSALIYLFSLKSSWYRNLIISFVSAGGYFIKPSIVIVIIAYVIVVVIKAFSSIQFKPFYKLLVIVIPMILIICSGNALIKSQIDSSKSYDSWHFVAMGMAGVGGYYGPDVEANQRIKSPEKRKIYNINLIKSRLKSYGINGYSKFLIQKQVNNTSDATFGWRNDGGGDQFLIPFGKGNRIYNKIRYIFTSHNSQRDWNGFAIIPQLVWVITLVGLLATVVVNDYRMLWMKLTIIGFMLFLLLYEGGRSRYVIQYLPYIVIASSVGLRKLFFSNSQKNNLNNGY